MVQPHVQYALKGKNVLQLKVLRDLVALGTSVIQDQASVPYVQLDLHVQPRKVQICWHVNMVNTLSLDKLNVLHVQLGACVQQCILGVWKYALLEPFLSEDRQTVPHVRSDLSAR